MFDPSVMVLTLVLANSMEKKSIKRLKVYDIEDCHQLFSELFPKYPASFLGKIR
jgi:hypothetical protein